MATLEHPFKPQIQALRLLMTQAHPGIAEGIKWNAPSFRMAEYFATTHLRAKPGLGLVLHLGAKVRELPAGGVVMDDPDKLLKWLARDRAMVEFSSAHDFEKKRDALLDLVRQWVRHV